MAWANSACSDLVVQRILVKIGSLKPQEENRRKTSRIAYSATISPWGEVMLKLFEP